jgi:hypothetical protein
MSEPDQGKTDAPDAEPDPIVVDARLIDVEQRSQSPADVIRFDPRLEDHIELTRKERGKDLEDHIELTRKERGKD